MLQQYEGIGIEILGSRGSAKTREIVEWAKRARLPYTWHEPEESEATAEALSALAPYELPLVRLPEGSELRGPSTGDLSRALGIGLELDEREEVDLLVIGGGPAGLGAAVYGASEGLDTLVVESTVLGGQAGSSRRIENYLGFPAGISGSELTSRAVTQARKFRAPDGDAVSRARARAGRRPSRRTPGRRSRGVGPRRRPCDRRRVPSPSRLRSSRRTRGCSRVYAAGPPEAQLCAAQRVGVVGGGNSAAQAAIWLARGGALVTLLHRRADLSETMSHYLIDDLERYGVSVRDRSEVRELHGVDGRLEAVTLDDGSRLPLSYLFLFLGANPCTDWLGDTVRRDGTGFVLTGSGAGADGLLETSVAGVYAAGDVRAGSIKRCATAVGEGAAVVRFVHERLGASPVAQASPGSRE